MGISFSEPEKISGQYGYHILRVQPNSPAELAGLEPFFDFILSINGYNVGPDSLHRPSQQPQQLLHRELSRHLGRPLQLSVYSSKQTRVRCVTLVPSEAWGGQGLLGASVRLCSLAGHPALAWRVLDVAPGSPASYAGLRPNTDYIVGADSPLQSPEDLFDLIEARQRCPTQLYVYSSSVDRCREVTVTPDPGWGGEGALGAGIGYGYLHQIPTTDAGSAGDRVTPNPPYSEASAILPANLPSAPESATAGANHSVHSSAASVTIV